MNSLSSKATSVPSGLMCELMADRGPVLIGRRRPAFGWIVPPNLVGGFQQARQIQVASSAHLLLRDETDCWDSAKVESARSVNVRYEGLPLDTAQTYFWRVRVWDGAGRETGYSAVQQFRIAPQESSPRLGDITNPADRYPLIQTWLYPQRLIEIGSGHRFMDFGKAAFGYFVIRGLDNYVGHQLEFRFGEKAAGNAVDMEPGASVRAGVSTLQIEAGTDWREVIMPQFEMPEGFVELPDSIPPVMPFRYVEVLNCPAPLSPEMVAQVVVHYPFDEEAAAFSSSNKTLNAVWDLCKYSIKAATFAGIYVDGDRERKPYEADAYINQLCHYCVDQEYSLARYTHEYLLAHPAWPTEWKHHSIFMAWADYLYTGNADSLEKCYGLLQQKLMEERLRPDGMLASTPDEYGRPDVVDWPRFERDDYKFTELNTVINAFHYRALVLMNRIAKVVHKAEDARRYGEMATRVLANYDREFFDPKRGVYRDGESTPHASLHANLFPLAFGMVAPQNRKGVVAFIKSRGMACSVYAAQYLLEALFENGEAEAALQLITDPATDRSWHHMLASGATITWEAWDLRYKYNLDWNHAWGAAPANILPRYVLGVRPLEPSFGKVLIQPQLGSLSWVKGKVPTIRGPIYVEARRDSAGIVVAVEIPSNMTGRVELRANDITEPTDKLTVACDGIKLSPAMDAGRLVIDPVNPGAHEIVVQWRIA